MSPTTARLLLNTLTEFGKSQGPDELFSLLQDTDPELLAEIVFHVINAKAHG